MKRKLVALMALLASLSLAQTASPKVTVNIPSVLQLTLDATDYLFDFGDASASGTVTIGGTPYTKASWAAYLTFLDTASGTQDFAPTSIRDAAENDLGDYGTVTVRTNRAQWTVKIDSISGTLTLGNGRVKVFAEKVSGKGASWTTTPTPITAASPLTLFNAGSGGQGRSVYKLYYLFTMDITDDIPLAGINQQITVNLLLTSP
ncbi:hypothetical protein BVI061214_01639 [Thermus aquaticus]|jgi:hypothetical protein|uniref:Uncharacterized protein n=1 Tax=Thermus aquaticus TaxID=271 RepID=A0A0M9AFP1_THEAQ|nr:hypothetical protein [Thermus aquaticus]KOX90448.1 hypothetical protein BVI061214_01639 [Thermus aquaticus]